MAVRTTSLIAALVLALSAPAGLAPAMAAPEESAEQFPAGAGREETFGTCSGCHAYRLVAAQGMSRERWDDTVTLMSDKHGMGRLEGEDRKVVLDYLAQAHPPKKPTGTGGFKIPFAPQ